MQRFVLQLFINMWADTDSIF